MSNGTIQKSNARLRHLEIAYYTRNMASQSSSSSTSSQTRLSLLSRARDRDGEAWSELVALYGPLIAHWCQRCGLSSHATADCIQEVFTSVSRSIATFRPQRESGAFRAWLWTITSNRIKDFFRREQRHTCPTGGSTALRSIEHIADEREVPDDEPSSAVAIQALMARAMEQVRGEFETKTWSIFLRSVVDQVSTEIVAKEFNVQSATVRQVRSRILRRLREQLGDLDDH